MTYLLNRWEEAFSIVILERLTSMGAQILYLLIITIINDVMSLFLTKLLNFIKKIGFIYVRVLTACVYEVPMKARRGCPVF